MTPEEESRECGEGCGLLDDRGDAATCANCCDDPSLWTIYPKAEL